MTARIYSEEAELYDIAFGWDIDAEADWLIERLGPSCRRVLEPGCGTGRLLAALVERGLEIAGIDLSEPMAAHAQARVPGADVILADMADFDLGRQFDGAVCAVSTTGLLTHEQFARHLEAMARHLRPGARYLLQQGIALAEDEHWRSEWAAERDGLSLRILWEASGPGRSRSRVEIVSGPRAGEVVEDQHLNTTWLPVAWRDAIAASPFTQAACYDGNLPDRPPVDFEQGGGLLWHELVAR